MLKIRDAKGKIKFVIPDDPSKEIEFTDEEIDELVEELKEEEEDGTDEIEVG